MLVTRLGVFDFTTGLQDGLSGDGEKEGGVREEGGLGRRRGVSGSRGKGICVFTGAVVVMLLS